MFFFQFLLQAGLFFTVPLFLSVALGLSAVETGVRLLPLSITLLAAAVGVPKLLPAGRPAAGGHLGPGRPAGRDRLAGSLRSSSAPGPRWSRSRCCWPDWASARSRPSSARSPSPRSPDRHSGEVGGLQNTATNLGASLGTALAGSVLIGGLTACFLSGSRSNPDVPDQVARTAQVELAGGIPFISDADLEQALDDAGVPRRRRQAVVDDNEAARLAGLQVSLAVLALLAALALFLTRLLPTRAVGAVAARE